MRGPTGKTQWVALLMVLTQTSALSLAAAFQLWPIRLTRPLASSKQDSNGVYKQNQRLQTSTTTTSTTTAAPHTELVFLIDAEDLGQQEQGGQQDQQVLNDTMILEEVVNHIHRNIKLNSNENCTNCAEQDAHKLRTISEFEATNQFLDERVNKSAQYKMDDGQSEPTTTPATTATYISSAGIGEENNRLHGLGSDANETANGTSSDPDDDRHIQYDTIITSSPISYEELRRQQASDSGANQMNVANFTLAYPIEDESDESSRQVSSAPLMIVSAIRNVSVHTPATNPLLNQYQSTTSSLSQHRATNTSQAQPRSMSGISSRLPQHSKAPYASNNLFNHPRQDPNHHATETTPILNSNLTGKAGPAQSVNQDALNSSINNKQSNNQMPMQQVSNSTLPVRGVTEGGELANSISKISSHLAKESSRNLAAQNPGGSLNQTSTNATAAQTGASSMSLADKLQAYINGNVNFSTGRQEPSNELERVVSKLAPTNELVELDPLPSSDQSHAQAQNQTPLSERYYSTSSGQNQRRAHIGSRQGDRHPADFFPEDDSSEYNHQMAHGGRQSTNTQLFQRGSQQLDFDRDSLKNVVGELLSDGTLLDEQLTTPAPILHRKTIEILSNQIKSSDNSLLASSSSNTMAVHQHKERSPPAQQPQQQHMLIPPVKRELNGSSRHHHQGGGTFAASLINVTAPMVLPLSASEAMENSIAAQFQQHQSGRQENQQRAGPTTGQHPAPHRSNYYVTPQVQPPHESIYMRPMNQFRPTTTTSSTQAPNEFNVAERDRTRLEQRLAASQLASGFRSPQSQFNPSVNSQSNLITSWSSLHGNTNLPTPASYLNALEATPASSSLMPLASPSSASIATTLPSITTGGNKFTGSAQSPPSGGIASNKDMVLDGATRPQPSKQLQQQNSTTNLATSVQKPQQLAGTTNGFITGIIVNTTLQQSQTDLIGTVTGGSVMSNGPGSVSTQVVAGGDNQQQQQSGGKRGFNLTRVEHISAECSNDLIRAIIIFNGTFRGIIYSSGYVRDPNCLYINGTGKTRYDFSIKLNQCGTLGRQELHSPTGPDEVRRRDQVMWNSLSIQYNPIIEQEWDEHFRVSCEYGSDFWKTISFNPFNVETNTGSPMVFTVDPPQCQMEILKGHGMVGPRQEATSGPVTVGDPLTLLIHMKSEKAGYDILVKNCIAHDGSQQKMQLIDSNGCVVNERFISPFRGTYNDQDLKHVTLYSYLKAFRFTGSPVLYLECEVHMCQSACPPQMCYWRSISKRSIGSNTTYEAYGNSNSSLAPSETFDQYSELGENLPTSTTTTEASTITRSSQRKRSQQRRAGKKMGLVGGDSANKATDRPTEQKNLSDKISLTRALEVRQERFSPDPAQAATGLAPLGVYDERLGQGDYIDASLPDTNQLMCYQRIEIFAFLFTVASILLAAVSVTIGCYCRASSLRRQSMSSTDSGQHRRQTHQPDQTKLRYPFEWLPRVQLLSSLNDSANLCYSPMSSSSATSPLSSPITFVDNNDSSKRSACSPYFNSSNSTRPQIYGRVPSSFTNFLGAGSTGDDLIQGNRGPPKRPPAANYIQRLQLARRAETNDERLLATKVARRN